MNTLDPKHPLNVELSGRHMMIQRMAWNDPRRTDLAITIGQLIHRIREGLPYAFAPIPKGYVESKEHPLKIVDGWGRLSPRPVSKTRLLPSVFPMWIKTCAPFGQAECYRYMAAATNATNSELQLLAPATTGSLTAMARGLRGRIGRLSLEEKMTLRDTINRRLANDAG